MELDIVPLGVRCAIAVKAPAHADIRAFFETTGVPFLPMSMAKGLLPDNHPQSAVAARRNSARNTPQMNPGAS